MAEEKTPYGLTFFGTTTYAAKEAVDELKKMGVSLDVMRIMAFPFQDEVLKFIEDHELLFVVEQNRDAQMRTLLINEFDINPMKLIPILNYDGMPITAYNIVELMKAHLPVSNPIPNAV